MSKTIEVYLWKESTDIHVVDLAIDGETVFTKTYDRVTIAIDAVLAIAQTLDLQPSDKDKSNLIIKFSNQCEKK